MAVKTEPHMIDFQALPPKLQSRVRRVVTFVDKRGSMPTRIEDVAAALKTRYGLAWSALDAAWNCGLITKVKEGNSCHWIRRSRKRLLIDRTSTV